MILFWKRLYLYVVLLSSLFCWFCSCQKKSRHNEDAFSRSDTIAVMQTALEDPQLDSIFHLAYSGKKMKLVSNEYLKSDYILFYKGTQVQIVDYDSTLHNPTFYPTPGRFYGEIAIFRRLPNGEVKIVLIFRGSGTAADFIGTKKNDRWQITKRIFGKI
ncbi:hypothetical protein [Larkinella soli]|uniref:hypothetical protein n=1 Tax=Larkinella soli TaxID=1770527 RepID=UPI000FFBC081|nr:hypothetical protein [Larkinella soli]